MIHILNIYNYNNFKKCIVCTLQMRIDSVGGSWNPPKSLARAWIPIGLMQSDQRTVITVDKNYLRYRFFVNCKDFMVNYQSIL